MSPQKIKRALISVYDKTGIVEFARALHGEFGIEIISTGGTARALKDAGIPVTLVEDITGFPEMLDGRVKTLHPKIFAAILADRDNPEHMGQLAEQGIEPIDMVVVNLYPFEKTVADPNCTFEQAMEMIDIGGVSLLRAAAKNHRQVLTVLTSRLHSFILGRLRGGVGDCRWDARDVFNATSSYDGHIRGYLVNTIMSEDRRIACDGQRDLAPEDVDAMSHPMELPLLGLAGGLSYGENPHQRAQMAGRLNGQEPSLPLPSFIGLEEPSGVGRRCSYNNYLDADAAMALCVDLTHVSDPPASACCLIKHSNACGAGVAHDRLDAYRLAYLGDPKAAMGAILACSFAISAEFAAVVMETYERLGRDVGAGGFFLEVWLAPEFSPDAMALVRGTKKNWAETVRLLHVGKFGQQQGSETFEYRSVAGGMLIQTRDLLGLKQEHWRVVTDRHPTESEMSDLRLAWLIAKHTKSNAISICKDGMLIGNGAGQMSRVMSCRIAVWLAQENGHAEKLKGAAAASDGFFPFRDGPELLLDAGVTAIIQPGGSKRDAEIIAACNERGAAMIFTGTRHFRH